MNDTVEAAKPQPFSLKTQLLSGGMTRTQLVAGEHSNVHVLCYASGLGENHGMHAHQDEEHGFIVLSGRAIFNTPEGKIPVEQHEGLFLPKGAFYEFFNPEPGPLVILRFGASASRELLEGRRAGIDGHPLRSSREGLIPTPIPNAYFE